MLSGQRSNVPRFLLSPWQGAVQLCLLPNESPTLLPIPRDVVSCAAGILDGGGKPSECIGLLPTDSDQQDAAACFRIAGICARRICRNASTVGLWDPRGQIAQRHKAFDRTVKGRRTVFCCSKPRAQLGTRETPRPLSTRRKTVVIRSVSCRILGEKPAWRHIPTTSSNSVGAPTR